MPQFLNPEQQWKKDERDRATHQRGARKVFQGLLAALQPYAAQAMKTLPDDPAKQGRLFMVLIKDDLAVGGFVKKYMGTTDDDARAYSWQNAAKYLLRDVSLGKLGQGDAFKRLDVLSGQGFQALAMSVAQQPIREALPERFRAFLPRNVVVDVDSDGTIQRVTDRFDHERFTLGEKIKRLRQIVAQYNDIAKKVKADLRSSDEVTKLCALITAIIMETGIRPGAEGNAAFKTINGEKVEIETFGAVTLGPAHVKFVRANFTQLEFIGKKGGLNTASLTDSQIIHVLNEYTEKALTKGSKFVFVTAEGETVSYTDLQRYFRERFKGIAPTDFRKLKATETVLNSLRDQQEELYQRIRDFAKDESQNLAERVVELLVRTIEAAMKQAQEALSHDSVETTRGAYIDPQVLLSFLSTGRASASMQDAILDNKIQLSFDPMKFIEVANARALAATFVRQQAKKASLRDVLEGVEEDLDTGFMRTAAAEGQPDPKKKYDLYVAYGQGADEVLKKDLKPSEAARAMKVVDSVLGAADDLNEEEHGAKLKKLQDRLDKGAFGVKMNLGGELFLVLKDHEDEDVAWHWTSDEWELE